MGVNMSPSFVLNREGMVFMLKPEVMIMESLSVKEVVQTCKAQKQPFRAPHHTISASALREELISASKGFILLNEVDKFMTGTLQVFKEAWDQMGESKPDIILMKRDVETEHGKLALEFLRS